VAEHRPEAIKEAIKQAVGGGDRDGGDPLAATPPP
jgi:hypothetical protein